MAAENIEPVARAICERELRAAPGIDPGEIPNLVERYWPVIASQMAAGLRDDAGKTVEHSVAEGIAAWEAWLDDR